MKILRPYQASALRYTMRTETPALFMDMRLGKTIVAVRRVIMYPRECNRFLVVGPYSVLWGWKSEIDENVYMFEGTGRERVVGLASAWNHYRWFLINKEGFLTCPTLCLYPWDCIIADESTFLRRPWRRRAETGKYHPLVTHYFCTKFKDVKYKWILTGTPKVKSELDYFCQLYFLNPSILGFKSYWEFRNSCFLAAENHQFYLKRKWRKWLYRKLADNCFFLKRKEVGLGGEKIYKRRVVQVSSEFRRVYGKIEDDFVLEHGDVSRGTVWGMESFLWMRRLCGGFVGGNFSFDHKLKEVLELLEGELAEEPVIIWCQFLDEIELLRKHIRSCTVVCGDVSPSQRERARIDFMKGRVKRFIGQPGCFKYGTDLSVSDTMIYFSTPYSETRWQTEDRFVSTEKNGSLLVIDIVVQETVEESILEGIMKGESDNDISYRVIRDIQKRERTAR